MINSNALRIRRMALFLAVQLLLLLPLTNLTFGQTQPTAVPRLVKFSGTVNGAHESPRSGVVGLTFALYKDEQGGAPLWLETQSAVLDGSGHYTVQLGATLPNGLPQELFVSGEARWLGVQPEGQPEQPRVLLLSVPYALKAGDAETLGGVPLSAFVLATPQGAKPAATAAEISATAAPPANAAVTGAGTINLIPLWDTTSDIVSSILSQTGTGTTAKVGINNTAPTSTLDVKGSSTVRGTLTLPPTSAATATAGKASQPLNFIGSSFNSGTATAVNQTFRLQTEPVGNNTTTTSGALSLLYATGTGAATETGLKIASNGQITFASGQLFPGTGSGTITGVTVGSGLIGGGSSGNVTLSLPTTCATNQILKWTGSAWACSTDSNSGGTIKGVTAGTALTGGGTTGIVTLNLDTTRVPQLNTANLFTADQSVTGNLTASGTVTGSVVNASGSFNLGNRTFAFGTLGLGNVFLGFAGNFTTTGANNTAIGASAFNQNSSGSSDTATGGLALASNTTGAQNTATGFNTLIANTTGGNNTATGTGALATNITGSNNTALGYNAGPDASSSNLSNATAIGANAVVSASNALALGGIGANAVSVGIGTAVPTATLDVRGTGKFTGPITFAAGQTFPGAGTITGVTAGTDLTGGGTTGSVTLNVDTTKVVTGITAGIDLTGGGTGGVQTLNLDTSKVPQLSVANTFTGNQTVNGNLIATTVGIGTAAPLAPLHIDHVASGNGQDIVMVTSGGSPNVASLAIQNTTAGGLRLREGAGTGATYLASTGSLRFITFDSGTPSNPSPAAMTIDTTGRVGIGSGFTPSFPLHVNGEIRGEGGLSLSSSGLFNVDAPFIGGGRFTILSNGNVGVNNPSPKSILDVIGNIDASGALIGGSLNVGGSGLIGGGLTLIGGVSMTAGATIGTTLSVNSDAGVGGSATVLGNVNVGGTVNAPVLSINGDTPMHAAPHMFITGFFPGNIGINETAAYVIPSRNIIITRMSYKLGTSAVLCAIGGTLSISYDSTGTPIQSLTMGSSFTADSGPLSFSVPANSPLILTVSSAPVCPPVGGVANAAVSVEYVMQ